MRLINIKVAPGAAFDLAAAGDYVRVRYSLVDLIIENTKTGERIEVSQGDDFEFTQFDSLRISHSDAADQIVKLIISKGKKAGSAQVGGSVALSGAVALDAATLAALESVDLNAQTVTALLNPVRGTGANTQKTVTNTSTSLVAANLNRDYLLIQNKDTTGIIYINFGAAATSANGLRIAPGASFELNSNILTAQIFAIGDIASNANIVVIEG